MSNYRYSAVNYDGKTIRDEYEAASKEHAIRQLRDRGIYVTSIKEVQPSIFTRELTFGAAKIKLETFTVFCRQLATLYESGIQMLDAIGVLAEQAEDKKFKDVLLQIKDRMEQGQQFSTALSQYPSIFSPVFIHSIRAGEASGNLDVMLNRMAIYHEKEHNLKEKVKSALVYPVIMLIIMAFVVTFMMIFVIPNFVASFDSMGLELPLPTKIVMNMSHFFASYWYIVLGIALLIIIGLKLIAKKPKGLYTLDLIKLKIPVFGKLIQKQVLARFSRTFSSLVSANVPILNVLEFLAHIAGNEVIKQDIIASTHAIKEGRSISYTFGRSKWFTPMIRQMLLVGEQTGALDVMMDKLANFYDDELEALADRLKTIVEPLMIVILASVVGTIVLSIMLPTFTMMEGL